MALAKVMKDKVIVDEIKVDLSEKEGVKMYKIKAYAGHKDESKVFHPDKALYKRSGKKGTWELYIDHDSLLQIDPQSAFAGRGPDPTEAELNREAEDILAAHKESKKRVGGDTQSAAIIISWLAMIIISVLLFLTFYFFFTSPHVIQIVCKNCGAIAGTVGIGT